MRRASILAGVLVLVAIGGCRSAPVETTGTAVVAGDTLYGRLPASRELQAFSFEGVEGSMLDFEVLADGGNIAAPEVDLVGPEGRQIDISSATESAVGAASMRVRGVVLLRNGIHKLSVRPAVRGHSTWYRFHHTLRFPPIEENRVRLTAGQTHPIYVSAPRRGLVAFRIKADSRSNVVPEIRGVKDPWGGRALDRSQVPAGASPPRVSRTFDGQQVLTFTAPRPGRYTILAAARTGTEGVASFSAEVRPAPGSDRMVYHPNTPPHFGVPGNRHGTQQPAAAPSRSVPTATPNGMTPPLPPPPSGPLDRVPEPPVSPLPPDPALARR